MKSLTRSERIASWRRAQGHSFADRMDADVSLGPYLADRWLRDPKTVLFTLARYKFVAQMLRGVSWVAEVGAGDGWASGVVSRQVQTLHKYDLSPLGDDVLGYDVTGGHLPEPYDAIYCLDVFEHVASGDMFFRNLKGSLENHGKLIVGTPSLESQAYASEPSRKLHVNCLSGEALRALALLHFRHVFMFSMNDEVVHTGFMPMAHYLWAVCAEPIR